MSDNGVVVISSSTDEDGKTTSPASVMYFLIWKPGGTSRGKAKRVEAITSIEYKRNKSSKWSARIFDCNSIHTLRRTLVIERWCYQTMISMISKPLQLAFAHRASQKCFVVHIHSDSSEAISKNDLEEEERDCHKIYYYLGER